MQCMDPHLKKECASFTSIKYSQRKYSTASMATASANIDDHLPIGSMVEVNVNKKLYYGQLKWLGYNDGFPDKMAGVELENCDLPCNDGKFGGRRYFSSPAGRAFFIQIRHCKPDVRFRNTSLDTTTGVQQENTPELEEEGASNLSMDVGKLLECPICFEILNEPKTLQCEHSFCKECIEEAMQFDENSVPFAKCPLCSSVHCLQKGKTVSSMKTSLLLKQMLDQLEKSKKRDTDVAISRCCEKTLSLYCGECDLFLCTQCMDPHLKRGCASFTSIKYSKSKNQILPFCERHNSFKYAACKTCADTICPYCRELGHQAHIVVSINEFSNIFKGHLTTKIETCKTYNDTLKDIVSNPCNQLANVNKLITERKTVVLSKLLCMLEKVCESKLTASQEMKGNVVSQQDKWICKMDVCKEALDAAESLKQKGNVEMIYNTASVLSTISSNFPEQMNIGNCVTQIQEGDGHTEGRLFQELLNTFGALSIPCLDGGGNVSTSSVDYCQSEGDSLLPELNNLNDCDTAKKYIKEKMQQFL